MDFGLTKKELELRRKTVGGSDANIIMHGDIAKIHRLWQVKRGEAEPEDLSGILPVVMGQWTEELNRIWFQKQTGLTIKRAGERIIHPKHEWMHATLDGVVVNAGEAGHSAALFEAKHTNPFNFSLEDFIDRYQPQMQHNMMDAGVDSCYLSYFKGKLAWDFEVISSDLFYCEALITAEQAFMDSVKGDKPPPTTPPMTSGPVRPSGTRVQDMNGNNAWASLARDWQNHKGAAGEFATAAKGLKGLVDDDVGHAHGYGVEVKRDKRGSLRIKEAKDD